MNRASESNLFVSGVSYGCGVINILKNKIKIYFFFLYLLFVYLQHLNVHLIMLFFSPCVCVCICVSVVLFKQITFTCCMYSISIKESFLHADHAIPFILMVGHDCSYIWHEHAKHFVIL